MASLQSFPRRRIAEKARHADQEFLEEEFQLLGVSLEKPHVLGDPLDLVDAHAPLDPAVDGALLVEGKVVARVRPQEDDDLFQGALGLALQKESRLRHERGPLEIGDDLSGEFLDRGHDVGQPCVDGASGHAVEFGRSRVLHEDHPRLLLDGLEAHACRRCPCPRG